MFREAVCHRAKHLRNETESGLCIASSRTLAGRPVIQCKWQASSGSVDEKYPYELACINHLSVPTIIVLDGGGYKPGAKEWLLGQVGSGNLRHVFDMGQFARFCSRGGI